MQRYLLVLILLLTLTPNADAGIRRLCAVSYHTEDGWSKEYLMEVTFLTGYELNNATRSIHFEQFEKYALLWFKEGEVAILELKDFLVTGLEFESDNFRYLYMIDDTANFVQVNADQPRQWRIRAKDTILFIDPRGNW